MARFIELETESGGKISVNIDLIQYFEPAGDVSRITFDVGANPENTYRYIVIKETYENLKDLISSSTK
jgi:hypothetical protein